jgi:nucleoside-diphosphate-sugar epimerase
MNVLVVGGAGYVGGAVTDLLDNMDINVKVYDSLLYEEAYLKDIRFVYGDVRDKWKLMPELAWADAVIWLAAIVGDGACALNPNVSVEVNQQAVKQLVYLYKKRIVFMSTCSVYGAQDAILDEKSPTNPLSIYAKTKLTAESYLKDSNAIIFRLGTLFGLGDTYSRVRFDLVVNTLGAKAVKSNKITVYGGKQYRPLLHVKDAALFAVKEAMGKDTGIYNLACENTTIIDLANKIKGHFCELAIEEVPQMFEDSRNYRVSWDMAKNIGFNPQYTVDDGIKEVKELLENKRIKNIDNPRYTNQGYISMFNSLAGESLNG